jgi:hypothetical protein
MKYVPKERRICVRIIAKMMVRRSAPMKPSQVCKAGLGYGAARDQLNIAATGRGGGGGGGLG